VFAGAFHGGDAAFVAAWAGAGIFSCVPGVCAFQVAAAPTQSTRGTDEIGSVTAPGARDLGTPHRMYVMLEQGTRQGAVLFSNIIIKR
jgi:hypothetical protein